MIYIGNLHKGSERTLQRGVVIRCDRASVLGNPFRMDKEAQRDWSCDEYRKYFQKKVSDTDPAFIADMNRILAIAKEKDVVLACWCYPKRCHTETIKAWLEQRLQASGQVLKAAPAAPKPTNHTRGKYQTKVYHNGELVDSRSFETRAEVEVFIPKALRYLIDQDKKGNADVYTKDGFFWYAIPKGTYNRYDAINRYKAYVYTSDKDEQDKQMLWDHVDKWKYLVDKQDTVSGNVFADRYLHYMQTARKEVFKRYEKEVLERVRLIKTWIKTVRRYSESISLEFLPAARETVSMKINPASLRRDLERNYGGVTAQQARREYDDYKIYADQGLYDYHSPYSQAEKIARAHGVDLLGNSLYDD